jgi:hypothetical protein
MLRKYPKGATHCVYPNDMQDELFYRRGSETLEIFIMGRHEWFPSRKPFGYLDEIHKLENPDQLVGE